MGLVSRSGPTKNGPSSKTPFTWLPHSSLAIFRAEQCHQSPKPKSDFVHSRKKHCKHLSQATKTYSQHPCRLLHHSSSGMLLSNPSCSMLCIFAMISPSSVGRAWSCLPIISSSRRVFSACAAVRSVSASILTPACST